MSKRHLVELQMMYKSLKVMALEAEVAEEQTALGRKEAGNVPSLDGSEDLTNLPNLLKQPRAMKRGKTQELLQKDEELAAVKQEYTDALEVFDEEIVEAQRRITDLQAQLDKEKREREGLQEKLASIQERCAVDEEELQQTKEQINQTVDACVKQALALKTARSVAATWLGLVRNKHREVKEQVHASCTGAKVEDVAASNDEMTKMQSCVRELQAQLDQEKQDNEAGMVMLQNHIHELRQQRDQEKHARDALQRQLASLEATRSLEQGNGYTPRLARIATPRLPQNSNSLAQISSIEAVTPRKTCMVKPGPPRHPHDHVATPRVLRSGIATPSVRDSGISPPLPHKGSTKVFVQCVQ